MPYMKMTCRAGRTKEVAKYYTYWQQPKGRKRQPKRNKTSEQQRKINDRHLEKKLTRILNANFDKDSWYLTFSYHKELRPDGDGLKKHRKKLLGDLRKIYKAEGKPFKYVETAEVGNRGGTHIHMIVNSIDIRKIKDLWKYGWVGAKPLDDSGQYRKLAGYFIKYSQKTKGTDGQIQKKAYNCSKNLIRPKPTTKKMKGNKFSREIKVPEGWYLDKDSLREGFTEDGYEFLYYTLIKEGG